MIEAADIIGGRIGAVLRSMLPAGDDSAWFNFYVALDSGLFLPIAAEKVELLPELPEGRYPNRPQRDESSSGPHLLSRRGIRVGIRSRANNRGNPVCNKAPTVDRR